MDRRFISHLENRPYISGFQDCYGLVREFVRTFTGVVLTDFARPEHLWTADNSKLWVAMSEVDGWENIYCPVADLKVGDVLAFAVRTSHINHLGIYIGDGLFLHHIFQRKSEVSYLSAGWKNSIMVMARHPRMGNGQANAFRKPEALL